MEAEREPSEEALRAFVASRLGPGSQQLLESSLRDFRHYWVRLYQLAERGLHLTKAGTEEPIHVLPPSGT